MKKQKYPVVDIGRCTLCGGCIEIAPNVFRYNSALHFVEVDHLDKYPEADVDEAIKYCPVDCICWETNEEDDEPTNKKSSDYP